MIKYLKEIREEPFMSSDEKITIRTARESDAPALLAIYAPYVENTAITFEYDVPSIEEFTSRIHHTLEKYPYLVAEKKQPDPWLCLRQPVPRACRLRLGCRNFDLCRSELQAHGNRQTPARCSGTDTQSSGNPQYECLHRLYTFRRCSSG